jgi:hypothetical protein
MPENPDFFLTNPLTFPIGRGIFHLDAEDNQRRMIDDE